MLCVNTALWIPTEKSEDILNIPGIDGRGNWAAQVDIPEAQN